MEKHTVNEHPAALSLQRSREELRQVLMPRGPDSRNPPGQFPRSKSQSSHSGSHPL